MPLPLSLIFFHLLFLTIAWSKEIQGTLLWQPTLGAKSAEIGDTPSFLRLAFHNGWQDWKADGRINSAKVLCTTSRKNLVNFGPLTPEKWSPHHQVW